MPLQSWAPQKPLKTFNSRKLERSGDPRCISLPQSGRTLDVTPSCGCHPSSRIQGRELWRLGNEHNQRRCVVEAKSFGDPMEAVSRRKHFGNSETDEREQRGQRNGIARGEREVSLPYKQMYRTYILS